MPHDDCHYWKRLQGYSLVVKVFLLLWNACMHGFAEIQKTCDNVGSYVLDWKVSTLLKRKES